MGAGGVICHPVKLCPPKGRASNALSRRSWCAYPATPLVTSARASAKPFPPSISLTFSLGEKTTWLVKMQLRAAPAAQQHRVIKHLRTG